MGHRIHLSEIAPRGRGAVNHTGVGTELRYEGRARRNPGDRDIP